MRTGDSFLGVKQLEWKADHSPQPSAKVYNARSFTSTSPICHHRVLWHRHNLTSTTYMNQSSIKIYINHCLSSKISSIWQHWTPHTVHPSSQWAVLLSTAQLLITSLHLVLHFFGKMLRFLFNHIQNLYLAFCLMWVTNEALKSGMWNLEMET
jgi:hypothetical protein